MGCERAMGFCWTTSPRPRLSDIFFFLLPPNESYIYVFSLSLTILSLRDGKGNESRRFEKGRGCVGFGFETSSSGSSTSLLAGTSRDAVSLLDVGDKRNPMPLVYKYPSEYPGLEEETESGLRRILDVSFLEKVSSDGVFRACCSFFKAFLGSQLSMVASTYMFASMDENPTQKNEFVEKTRGSKSKWPVSATGFVELGRERRENHGVPVFHFCSCITLSLEITLAYTSSLLVYRLFVIV